MIVYLVYRDCNYDGDTIIGIFYNKEKAENAKNNYLKNRESLRNEIEIEKIVVE